MAEELVLPAKVTDGFSKPLKDLSDKLRNLRPSPALQATQRHFVDLRKQVEAVGNAMKGMGNGLAGGLGLPGLSLGALSAAGAMAALGASVQSFATQTVKMRNFAQDTGIATQKLKELKAVAAGLGVSEDAIQGGLAFGSHNLSQLKRGQGTYADIAGLRGGGQSIANELRDAKDADDYTERGLRILQRQKNAEQRRVLSGYIFGSDEFAAFGAQDPAELNRRRAAARKSIGDSASKQDEKNAEAFLDATSKVSAALEKLKNSVGGALAPSMTALAEAVNSFTVEHSKDVADFFQGVGKAIGDYDWKGSADSFVKALQDIKDFLDRLSGTGNYAPGESGSSWLSEDQAKPGQVYKDKDGNIRRKEAAPEPGVGSGSGGMRDTFMGDDPNVHKMAYHPGARLGAMGISAVSQSATVAILALGVQKGMEAFYQGLQSGSAVGAGDSGGGGGGFGGGAGDGFQTAAYRPSGGVRMGGGGRGGSVGVSPSADRTGGVPFVDSGGRGEKNAFLDFIASRESGKAGYDAVLGNGAYGRPNKPVSQMTLNEVLSFGNILKRNYAAKTGRDPSSAMGRYQIVGKTLRGLMKQMGLKGTEIYSPELQDEMAWRLARNRGRNAAGLRSEWESFNSRSNAQILQMYDKGMQQHNDYVANKRQSLAKKSAATLAPGGQGPHGQVDITVKSKDHPIDVKRDDSPIHRNLKIDRGNKAQFIDT